MLTGDLRRRRRAQDGGHGSKSDEEDLEHGCLEGEERTSETVGEVRSGTSQSMAKAFSQWSLLYEVQ